MIMANDFSAIQCGLSYSATPSSAMPNEISSEAKTNLEDLAAWVSQSAKMKGNKPELLECVDDDRKEKARPLLESLGYAEQVSMILFLEMSLERLTY